MVKKKVFSGTDGILPCDFYLVSYWPFSETALSFIGTNAAFLVKLIGIVFRMKRNVDEDSE